MAAKPARGAGLWYYGWTVVAVTVLSQLSANALTFNCFSLFLRHWSADLHTPVATLVLALTAMVLIASVASPVVGMLADRFSARVLFGAGLTGMGMFYIALGRVTAGWQVLALYGVLAAPMLTLCTAVPGNAVISRWFVRRLGLALGLSSFGIGLGGVVAPPLVAALLPVLGWRLIWQYAGLLLIGVVMPLVVVLLRDAPGPGDDRAYLAGGDEAAVGHAHHGRIAGGPGWRAVLGRGRFWLLVATYLAILAAGSAVIQNLAPYAAAQGFGEKTAALLIAVAGGMHVIGSLVLGALTDRFGPRACFVGLSLTVGGGLTVLAIGGSLPMLILGVALIGLNAAVMTPLSAAVAGEFGPEGFGQAFGLAMLFLPASSPFAYVLARTHDLAGSYRPALLAFAGLQAVALVMALGLGERRRAAAQAV